MFYKDLNNLFYSVYIMYTVKYLQRIKCLVAYRQEYIRILNLDKFVVCVSQMMLSNSHTKIVAALLL